MNKKQLSALKHIHYDSNIYYDEEVNDYYYYEAENELNFTCKLIKDICNTDYFIVSGSSGTWQGNKEISSGYVDEIKSIINRMNVDEYSIGFDKENDRIFVKGIHHDGVNYYEIRPIEWLSKKEMLSIIEDFIENSSFLDERENINNFLKEYGDMTLSKANKDGLIYLLRYYSILEDYR